MGKVKQMLTDEQQEYVEGLRCELSELERLLGHICDQNDGMPLPDKHFFLQCSINDARHFLERTKDV